MARTVHQAQVVLRGENRASAAFKQASRQADDLQRRISGVSLRAAGMATAIAAAGAGLVLATKKALDHADATAKQADAIGISTDALQEYRHAAELSGVANDKLDASLLQFTKRLGEAREGTGSLAEFLVKYDKDLLGAVQTTTSAEQALDLVLRKMAETEDQAERAALANAAFGRSGVQLTNILRDGTAGLEDMRREARDLGLVLDEDLLRNAEAANDALTRMERVVGRAIQKLLLELAPLIEEVGDSFADNAPAIADFTTKLAKFFGLLEPSNTQRLAALREELDKQLRNRDRWLNQFFDDLDERLLGTDSRAARQAAIDELQGQIRTIERLAKEGATFTPPADEAGERPTILRPDLEEKQAEKIKATNERLLLSLREARVRAAGDEEELLRFRLDRQLQMIADSDLKEAELREAKRLALETFELDLDQQRQERQERLDSEAEARRERDLGATSRHSRRVAEIWKSGLQGQLQTTSTVLGQISRLQETNSKAMFKIGKAAAIAQAIIDTHQAAISAYKAMAGIPVIGPKLGAIAAAAALAYGFARVKQIAAQKFGGGGTGGGGGGGAPASATPSLPAPGGGGGTVPDLEAETAPARARRIDISIAGAGPIWTRDMVLELIAAIQEALDDGTVLTISEA
jgi:hypothetical protein